MTIGNVPATGDAIVSLAARHIGQVYKLGSLAPKNNTNWGGPWDCAEFCSWLVYQASGQLYGCAPKSDDPATADAYTGYWRDDAKARGTIISIEDARHTPGALHFRVPTTIGHIVVSDGNGGTIEAMGTAYCVRRGPVSGRTWDFGILVVPRVSYKGSPALPRRSEEPAPSEKVVILRRQDVMAEDPRVEVLQRALAAAGFDPGPFDGLFGALTEGAVFEFQSARHLYVDGEVGPETGRALKLKFWKPHVTSFRSLHDLPRRRRFPPAQADWPDETRSVNSEHRF